MSQQVDAGIFQIKNPKMQSGAPNLYGDANKVHDLHSAVCWTIGFNSTNQQFNQRRKGKLGRANCSNREHEYIRRPSIVKTFFSCRRYTVKSHAWENQQHACYGKSSLSAGLECLPPRWTQNLRGASSNVDRRLWGHHRGRDLEQRWRTNSAAMMCYGLSCMCCTISSE